MSTVLNGALEVGVRALHLLAEVAPGGLDLNRLVLLDHCVVHSEDHGGPPSLHPPLPIRAGELGVRRETIQTGLQALISAGLVSMQASSRGVRFSATDDAASFLAILASQYAGALRERAGWVLSEFAELDEESLREQMNAVTGQWTDEFYGLGPTGGQVSE
jgi:hypothetical protein